MHTAGDCTLKKWIIREQKKNCVTKLFNFWYYSFWDCANVLNSIECDRSDYQCTQCTYGYFVISTFYYWHNCCIPSFHMVKHICRPVRQSFCKLAHTKIEELLNSWSVSTYWLLFHFFHIGNLFLHWVLHSPVWVQKVIQEDNAS